jgi:predicted NUDIX family NTP pyrophosphohydrolase
VAKGEFEPEEDPLQAARREFKEETGFEAGGPFVSLGSVKQPGGKTVHAWAFEGDFDPGDLVSNTFSMEWPRNSGRTREFPEVDRAAWFSLDEARRKILSGQLPLLKVLQEAVERLA